jgi:hypothetical protein
MEPRTIRKQVTRTTRLETVATDLDVVVLHDFAPQIEGEPLKQSERRPLPLPSSKFSGFPFTSPECVSSLLSLAPKPQDYPEAGCQTPQTVDYQSDIYEPVGGPI